MGGDSREIERWHFGDLHHRVVFALVEQFVTEARLRLPANASLPISRVSHGRRRRPSEERTIPSGSGRVRIRSIVDPDDLNLFMMCERPDRRAFTSLADGYTVRSMTADDLDQWKAFPFDSPDVAAANAGFMTEFFTAAYGRSVQEFLDSTLFVLDRSRAAIATCGIWRAYDELTTVQWLKVIRGHEGHGLGRALLSIVLERLPASALPVYLHTQPDSYRAIKLYTDFGFVLLDNTDTGGRTNDLVPGLARLGELMTAESFERLRIGTAPPAFESALGRHAHAEF